MCGDIVDHQEWVTGKREEATNYAVFTFMRKMGQALAAVVPLLIGVIGYDKNAIGTQSQQVIDGIYNVATLGQLLLIVLMLVLILLYPLNKKTTDLMQQELQAQRAEKISNN